MYIKRNKRHQTSVSIFMTDNYTNNYFSFFSLICTQREIKYNECFIFCINVVWKKVIKESLIFVCQIFLWKKVIKKNFDFCLSKRPLKESNQKKTLIFACQSVLWKKGIDKPLIFAYQIVHWKKVIKKTLTFAEIKKRELWQAKSFFR